MKKTIAILLVFCVLLPLTLGTAFADNAPAVQSAEEFEQMLQKAQAGDAAAMAVVGTVYYRGSFRAGVTRDFAQAQEWFEKAAAAGNKDVLASLASLYEKGSGGERNLEKAYNYYKMAAEAGNADAAEKLKDPVFATFVWKENSAKLTGRLGETVPIAGRDIMPFYLDAPLADCSAISMELCMLNYSGWPFGLYALYGMDQTGNWKELGRFQIEQFQKDGEVRTYDFPLAEPGTFVALAVVIIEDGMDFTLYHSAEYYVDKGAVSAYSDTLREPVFNPSAEQFPVVSSHVYTSAYVNPYPAG
ncbi:MAG: sel1 repeat family protein [Oscillospiraceae bacterium]|nr:sel1 repeat family protein [Oscillospiraceae bacterium]